MVYCIGNYGNDLDASVFFYLLFFSKSHTEIYIPISALMGLRSHAICPDKSGPQCLNIWFILWKIKRRGVLIAQGAYLLYLLGNLWLIGSKKQFQFALQLGFGNGTNVCSFSLLLVKCVICVKQTEISDHPS